MRLPDGLAPAEEPAANLVTLAPGVVCQLQHAIHCRRWGGYLVGEIFVRARDPMGLFVRESWVRASLPLRVYPRPETVRSVVSPMETQVFAGNELSRATGEGIEFADTRPFMPGDRLRRINWRLTTRLGEPYVNEMHRERNADIVIFLDTFAEARHGEEGTRLQAVRAAAALADLYLQRRDRIGLVSYGGILRWLQPSMGLVQRYRIIDALIETDIVFSYAWKEIRFIPPAVLRPKSLVIAISPLLDERAHRRLARSAGPPLRSGDHRSLSRAIRSRAGERPGAARLAPRPGGHARAIPASWRSGCGLVRRSAAGASRAGGAGISPLRASRARLITAGAALAAALALAAYPAMSWPDVGALPLIGGAAVVVLVVALALGLMAVVPWAIALLACEFVVALAARHVQASLTAAIYGAALLVVAELTFLSIQLRMPSRAEPGFFKRHALTVAAVALSALGISVVAAVLSAAPLAGSLPLLASGVGAVLVMIAIVVTIVWRIEGRRQ